MAWGIDDIFIEKLRQDYESNQEARRRSRENQLRKEDMERNSLTSRMEEARKAGLHPLVGLGVSPAGSSGSYSSYESSRSDAPGTDIVRGFSRAAEAWGSREERELQKKSIMLDLEGKELDNQYKASQLRLIETPSPAIPEWNDAGSPMPGQGESRTKMRPSEIIASQSGDPASQAGAITDYGYAKTSQGGLTIVPSQDVKERIEDQFIPEMSWSVRNTYFKDPPRPGKEYNHLLRKGEDWEWIPHLQEWRPADEYGNIRGMSTSDWGYKFQRTHTKPRRK